MRVVGLGTQDSLAEAQEFVSRHQLTFPMLWERGFDAWQAFGITRQPAAVLVSAAGEELGRWPGALSERDKADVVRLVESAAGS